MITNFDENVIRDALRKYIDEHAECAVTGLSPLIGVHHHTLFGFLNGRRPPQRKTLAKIRKYLNDTYYKAETFCDE